MPTSSTDDARLMAVEAIELADQRRLEQTVQAGVAHLALGLFHLGRSTLDEGCSTRELVRTYKSGWRLDRSCHELKRELSLDRYDGRSFAGWHHHVSVVLACVWPNRSRPRPSRGYSSCRMCCSCRAGTTRVLHGRL